MNKELNIFELTQSLLEDTEIYILNYKDKKNILFPVFKEILFPIQYLLIGWNNFTKPFVKWIIMIFIFISATLVNIRYYVANAQNQVLKKSLSQLKSCHIF